MSAAYDMLDDIMIIYRCDPKHGAAGSAKQFRWFLGSTGKTWALKRIQQACKLNLTVSAQSHSQHNVLWDGAGGMMEASEGFTRLKTLVPSSHLDNKAWQPAYDKQKKLVIGSRAVPTSACSNQQWAFMCRCL